jgi:hypothetical protein
MRALQLKDIDLRRYTVVKDKYHRQYDGINHGRQVLHNPADNTFLKVFNPGYCRLTNFRQAYAAGFFENEIFGALAGLIYSADALMGYLTRGGQTLAPVGVEDFGLIPGYFFDKFVTHCRAHALAYYDLVPQNIIALPGGALSLVDLESIYAFSETGRMEKENACFKPASLPALLGLQVS